MSIDLPVCTSPGGAYFPAMHASREKQISVHPLRLVRIERTVIVPSFHQRAETTAKDKPLNDQRVDLVAPRIASKAAVLRRIWLVLDINKIFHMVLAIAYLSWTTTTASPPRLRPRQPENRWCKNILQGLCDWEDLYLTTTDAAEAIYKDRSLDEKFFEDSNYMMSRSATGQNLDLIGNSPWWS